MAGARTFRLALRDSLPVLMGYTTMGFVAGVLLAAKGNVALAPLWGFLSSALWVTGTMSIAGVPHIAAHISAAAFALMTLAVNFRYVRFLDARALEERLLLPQVLPDPHADRRKLRP